MIKKKILIGGVMFLMLTGCGGTDTSDTATITLNNENTVSGNTDKTDGFEDDTENSTIDDTFSEDTTEIEEETIEDVMNSVNINDSLIISKNEVNYYNSENAVYMATPVVPKNTELDLSYVEINGTAYDLETITYRDIRENSGTKNCGYANFIQSNNNLDSNEFTVYSYGYGIQDDLTDPTSSFSGTIYAIETAYNENLITGSNIKENMWDNITITAIGSYTDYVSDDFELIFAGGITVGNEENPITLSDIYSQIGEGTMLSDIDNTFEDDSHVYYNDGTTSLVITFDELSSEVENIFIYKNDRNSVFEN